MKSSERFGYVILGIAIIIGIAYGVYKFSTMKNNGTGSNKTRQAVFLDNGQVYFGYASNQMGKNVILRDIYYLQVQQQDIQPAKDKSAQPQINLVKLGSELHGPVDEMRINRDHILFIEDMKDESKVGEAIAEFVKNGNKPATTTTPSTTTPTK